VDGHGILANDLHLMSLNICDIRSKYPNLRVFKVVTAVMSVVESDWGSVR